MRRITQGLTLAFVAAAALASASVTAAHASEASTSCPAASVCLWEQDQLAGPMAASHESIEFAYLPPALRDDVSSWASQTRYRYCLYDNGTVIDSLPHGGVRPELPAWTDDRADALGRC
jgi:hypothetical protein